MIKSLQLLRSPLLLSALLGIGLVFAFAPFSVFPLAILAPAGLLALMQHASPKRAFWLGFTFGLGLFGAGVYWVYIAIHHYGDVPIYLSILIAGGLIAILALFPAVTCYWTNRYFSPNNTARLVFAFPAIWLFSEWVRSWIACGFPWLFIGYSQTNSPLKGYAPIFSVYGCTLAALVVSGLIVNTVRLYQQQNYRSMYINLFSILLIFTLGSALSHIPWTTAKGKPLTVSLVQGDIPQSLKWVPEYVNLSYDRYTRLSEPLWGKSNLIIWPEAAIPETVQTASHFIDKMDAKAREYHTPLILGIPMQSTEGNGYYNAIVTLGDHQAVYLKRRLVPYGEYVPFQELSAHILNFMDVPMSNMLPGKMFQKPFTIDDTKINASICFEITFPELIHTRDSTIGMLLTVTNDAWFGNSIAKPQHLQMAIMRAIELGRPVLFASNDGITAFIDPSGKLVATAPPHTPYVLTGQVQPMNGLTPWMTNGMDPILVILLSFVIGAVISNRKERVQNGRTIQTQRS